MTRINVGIPVRLLSDIHLRAEHREIKRVPNHLAKHGLKCFKNAPADFTLGKGHFLFFIGIGKYTYRRYQAIYAECKRRGFNMTDYSSAWDVYKRYPYSCLFKDWLPEQKDILLLIERLKERDPVHYRLLNHEIMKLRRQSAKSILLAQRYSNNLNARR